MVQKSAGIISWHTAAWIKEEGGCSAPSQAATTPGSPRRQLPLTDGDIAGISIAPALRVVPGLISAPEERQQEVMNFCPKPLFQSARYWHLLQCWVLGVWSEFLQEIKYNQKKCQLNVSRDYLCGRLYFIWFISDQLLRTLSILDSIWSPQVKILLR